MKPMLAAKLTEDDLSRLRFPLLVSPKLDGIRCLIMGGEAVSRNIKPIPNERLRAKLRLLPNGLDGELIIPGANFGLTSSAVMSEDGLALGLVEYHVFDLFIPDGLPYIKRLDALRQIRPSLTIVKTFAVGSLEALLQYEHLFLEQGYEGIIIRDPNATYKYGRSTIPEQGLMKLKRFADGEAEVVGVVEQMHNTNVAKHDALGRTKRSSAKAGKVPTGLLGALKVRDIKTGVEFEVGTGFDAALRQQLWAKRRVLKGKLVKYKYQPTGGKEKPRFPVFLGFRDRRDV